MKTSKRGVTLHTDANAAEVESADIAFGASGTHREQVAELLRQHPAGLTMHQCAELLGWNSRDNVNPRMQELKEMGVAFQPGERRATGLGGYAEVWRHTVFARPAGPETVVFVQSTGRTVTRRPRPVPQAKHTALPERALDETARKMQRGKAQSKSAPVRAPRPRRTPEEIEELRRRAEEQLEARIRG